MTTSSIQCSASSVQRSAAVEPLLFFSGLVPDDVRNRGEADETLQSHDADAAIACWTAEMADGYDRKLNE